MASYQDFYEQTFGDINLGDNLRIYRDGIQYEGILIFKSEYFITLQLKYYREGISMADFYTGHAKLITSDIDLNDLKILTDPVEDEELI